MLTAPAAAPIPIVCYSAAAIGHSHHDGPDIESDVANQGSATLCTRQSEQPSTMLVGAEQWAQNVLHEVRSKRIRS